MDLQEISDNITIVNNFPKQGITFRDISKLLTNHKIFLKTIMKLKQMITELNLAPDYIAGFESRGFLFTQLATELNCGFIMLRKSGKLPNSVSIEYDKEYGKDQLCIQKDVVKKNSKILLIDDLIATGGTVVAGCKLIELIECIPIGCIGLVQLVGLKMNEDIKNKNIKLYSLLKYQYDNTSTTLDKNLNNMLKITKYTPLESNNFIEDTIVFYHDSVATLGKNYIANNKNCRRGTILYNKFPDLTPNITFEKMEQLEDKKIIFILSLYDTKILFEQLSMLLVLPRQLINSLNIYITYFSVGTMERVDKEGILATADTMAKIISNCLELTKEGKPIIHIFDIHALPIRFYFNSNNVIIKLESGIPMFKKIISDNTIIVFPDDGAYKRFKTYFTDYKIIVCSKIREGNTRNIKIIDKINFPEITNNINDTNNIDKTNNIDDNNNNLQYDEVIIVDDLIQTGGTIIECKKALQLEGYKNISAYVTHSVFPNDGWNKILDNNFHNFYTTNSIPEVTDKLVNKETFKIINLFGNEQCKNINIYVSSHNNCKLQAVYDSFLKTLKETKKDTNLMINVYGVNVESGVMEQPIGATETINGCETRYKNIKTYLEEKNIQYDYIISIENGLIGLNDVCYCIVSDCNKKLNNFHSSEIVTVPQEYYDICVKNQHVTIGQIIQKKTGINLNNWHEHFNENKKTRKMIIEETLMTNLKNLNY